MSLPRLFALALAWLALLAAPPLATAQTTYRITDTGALCVSNGFACGRLSSATAVNDAGLAVGYSQADPASDPKDGFRWASGTLTRVSSGGGWIRPVAVNGDGTVVGYLDSDGDYLHVFWTPLAETTQRLPGLNNTVYGQALGINASGTIVGWSLSGTSADGHR